MGRTSLVYVKDGHKSLHTGFHANAAEPDPTYDFSYGFCEDILIEVERLHSKDFWEMPMLAVAHSEESIVTIDIKRIKHGIDY